MFKLCCKSPLGSALHALPFVEFHFILPERLEYNILLSDLPDIVGGNLTLPQKKCKELQLLFLLTL